MAAVLDSLKPLVALLAQAAEPAATLDRLQDLAARGRPGGELTATLVAEVTDARLVPATLRFARVLDTDGALVAGAPVRLAQVQVLLEASDQVWAPGWDLVLTIPGFLRPSLDRLTVDLGPGRLPRETQWALTAVADAAQDLLLVAAPFLHVGFISRLVPAAERVLAGGGEVLVITRALAPSTLEHSSANEAAVRLLRDAGARIGRPVTVRSWEEGSLGVHFKAVVADNRLAYLGSANLTPAGISGHAEAGVLIRGSQVGTLAAWMRLVADELARRRLPSA